LEFSQLPIIILGSLKTRKVFTQHAFPREESKAMSNCNFGRNVGRIFLAVLLPFLLLDGRVGTLFAPAFALQAQEVLTNESILKMRAANFDEATIIAAIEQQPGKYSLGVDAMIALRQAGVSESVIQAMLHRSAQPAAMPSASPLVIPDGTVVKLRLKKTLSSGSAAVGEPVPVEVAEDVVVAGVVVAARETLVPTVVKTANPAKRFHGNSKLELEFQHVVLADGTNAPLRPEKEAASNKTAEAAKKAGRALESVSIGAVKHGKEAELPAGLLVTARIDGAITFRGQKPVSASSIVVSAPQMVLSHPGAAPAAVPPAPMLALAEVTTAATAAGAQPPAPRLTATFLHSPPRLDLSDASGTVVASHPLLKEASLRNPAQPFRRLRPADAAPVHITNPAGNVLYVLQSASKVARISAFDLTTGAALGNTDLSVATRTLQFNSDDSRLMAFGSGGPLLKTKEQKTAVITVIDPATLQVKFVQSFGFFASMMRYIGKLDRLLVMDAKRTTIWFVDPRAAEAPPIKLAGPARGGVVSSDGTRLLTLVRNVNKSGKKTVNGGVLNQFDVSTGRLLHTSEKLRDAELLIRLGDGDEYWVLMHGRMQRLTNEGEPAAAIISFQEEDKQLGRGLGGMPGSSLAFGKRFAINVLKPEGSLSHKVALIDPETGRVDSVTSIGRPGVRRGKTAKRWGIALALDAAMAAAGGAAGAGTHTPLNQMPATPVFVPGVASQVSDMAISQDEKTVYVMDVESDDVTAVKSDGTVAAILPIKCDNSAQLWRPSKGPFVYHFRKSAVTVIDTAENKVTQEIPIAKGFNATRITKRNEFYLCDKTSCEIWNAVNATSALKLDRRSLSARLTHADEPAEDVDTSDDADPAKEEPASNKPAAPETVKPKDKGGSQL
jgi:DNA-binding beta-propeller fold protein YncE